MITEVKLPEAEHGYWLDADVLVWKVENGSAVYVGQAIAELQLDKANVELVAPVAGTLDILPLASKTLSPGTIIARIQNNG